MKSLLNLLLRWLMICSLGTVLVGCAALPPAPPAPPTAVLHDGLFEAVPAVGADDLFTLTPAMQRYLATELSASRLRDPRRQLIDALYNRGKLQLDYDSVVTVTAGEAFEARRGNCLSLMVMTAAFAKALALPVQFNSAMLDESWSRQGNLYLASGHVNLTLSPRGPHIRTLDDNAAAFTIDFLPPSALRGLRSVPIDEITVAAMYMNNRAAETMVAGRLDEAYAWARAALLKDPRFVPALNTLGVIYARHGHPAEAATAFAAALERDAGNANAMSNLAGTLEALGRTAEAAGVRARLAELDRQSPFQYFAEGLDAMREHRFTAARERFSRAVARYPENHEFHFWLARAHHALGDAESARQELLLAVETSPSSRERAQYVGKLAHLKADMRTQ